MPKINELTEDTVLNDGDLLLGYDIATAKTKYLKGSTIRAGLALAADLVSHTSNTSNPHAVTKTQVGLSNVPNTDATARANHTGTQSADTITDGSTNKVLTAAEKTKLDAISGTNTGDQTVSDAATTFTDITTNNVSITKHGYAPKAPNDATKYLDGSGAWSTPAGSGGGSGDMILASAQTITGAKTFNPATLLDKGNQVFNVKSYGAVGNDTADDTTAIQSAIAAAAAVGGVVWFPAGTYKITAALKLYTGTTPTIVAYSNIILAGAGSATVGGSIIKQYTTATDVIQGLNDVANGAQSTNITIQDLGLLWGTATLTNSGNGIYLKQQAAGGPSYQQFNLKNVTASNFQGSGKYGFNIESMIVSTLDTCMAVACANGFFLNGGAGGAFNSVSTSVTFLNCYANMAANGINGFNCLDNTYIQFDGCAVDIGANSAGVAYLVDSSSAIAFNACGCELDGTHTLTNMWKITNSSSGVGLFDCYSFQSKTAIDVYVTGTSVGVTLVGHQDNSSVSGSTGLKVDAGSSATEIDSNWGGVATPRTIAAGAFNIILSDSAGNLTALVANLKTSAVFSGSTSGTTTVKSGAIAGSSVLTLPIATDTLMGKATTDILTNKTYDTAGTGNVFKINGTTISAVTGSGAAVLATSPTLITPVISSIVNTGTLTLPTATDTLVGRATTDTLTNKRITKRSVTTAGPGATPSIATDTTDYAEFTALALAITSMTTNLTGTPVRGDTLWISFTDNGTARAITWGASFEASGTQALPTTTVISTRLDVGFTWNVATSKWRCVAAA